MTRARICLAASFVAIASASIVRAQTTTADAVAAFVRGDYQRAADILKPIAEESPLPNYDAKFLMGTMYENGLGVAADRMRACASYMLAAEPRGSTPFAVAAGTLVRALHESMTREDFESCELLASLGFDHGFQPVTFALEPGDWISWDLKGVTIGSAGKETRIQMPPGQGLTRFLPLQHIALAVGPTRSTRRHFIETSAWVAARDRLTWTLSWGLFEVVRNELIPIAAEGALTVSAEEPPTAPPFDVHEFARVRVNDAGEAEWVVSGPPQRVATIESDEDRQETRLRKLAIAAADARVDWKVERDVRRAPALRYVDGDGCGNVFVYGWSEDRTEAIEVHVSKNLLQLSTTGRTFDLATTQTGLDVVVHTYARPLRSWPFCTDVRIMPGPLEDVWRATQGTVTIELSAPGVSARAPFLYRATIRIIGAEFVNGSGVRVKQVQPISLTALVGGMSG